ncbi:TetR/AcrR family transcriptional regulator [Leptospira andrefontaineae]|uniref:TetR/AcrR family transcriptional regulator n=1 Tax=Leptospira andrefontaineae TaxID=2484976 RepID=A0A4V3JFD5_9LEPT|nr:TetR/AcrR family transcriptional regulator [Leptospira andrefontaineae]TGK36624.1 TetR/AcrR family transcriptional regulator [Leptospira andrefontaineae]
MSTKEKGVKDRILETAVRLFQTQGYGNTGINQIIQESQTAKASFYDYYPSKDLLGKAYIEFYGKEQLILLDKLRSRSETAKEFILAWTQILRRQTRKSEFAGCPMANTVAQIASNSPSISEEVKKISERTISYLADFLKQMQKKGQVPKAADTQSLARKVFACYEGVLQIWKLTGKVSALDDLPEMVDSIIKSSGKK